MYKLGEIQYHVGKQLRKRRKSLGYTQNDVAKLLKITFQQIQKYESGASRISAQLLYKFHLCLHVPVEYFFQNIDNNEYETMNEPNVILSKIDMDIIRLLSQFEDDKIKQEIYNLFSNIYEYVEREKEKK